LKDQEKIYKPKKQVETGGKTGLTGDGEGRALNRGDYTNQAVEKTGELDENR